MTTPAEKHLLSETRAGRSQACAQLVRTHYESIYRFLLHLTGDVHAAEDLTQDTFAKVWAAIGGFRERSALKTWLHRIAYSTFVDWMRRARCDRQATRSGGTRTFDLCENPRHLDGLLADECSRHLYEAVERLNHREHLVIVLHYFQGLSFKEMAEVLDEPAGTVKWRVSQAIGELRSLLKGMFEP